MFTVIGLVVNYTIEHEFRICHIAVNSYAYFECICFSIDRRTFYHKAYYYYWMNRCEHQWKCSFTYIVFLDKIVSMIKNCIADYIRSYLMNVFYNANVLHTVLLRCLYVNLSSNTLEYIFFDFANSGFVTNVTIKVKWIRGRTTCTHFTTGTYHRCVHHKRMFYEPLRCFQSLGINRY